MQNADKIAKNVICLDTASEERSCERLMEKADKGLLVPWVIAFGRMVSGKRVNSRDFFVGLMHYDESRGTPSEPADT